MRKIDDRTIIEKFNETKEYEIKTSSKEILNLFKAEESKATEDATKKTTKTKNKKVLFGGIGVSLLAVATCSIILFVVLNSAGQENVVNPPILKPITSTNVLSNELLTLSSFKTYGESTSSNQNLRFLKKRASILKESDFEKIVNDFDSIQSGAMDILNRENSIMVESAKEVDFLYESKTYKYCDNYYSINDDFKVPFMSFYYNEIDETSIKEEFNSEHEYLIMLNNEYYDCYIAKESEIEEDEREEEIKILCINEVKNEYILIEKENEYEGKEVENSYSISYFSSLNNLKEEVFDYTLTYDLESEGDEEELEISVETPFTQSEFQNISLVSQSPLTYSFLVEYENDKEDIQVENLRVNLTYENEQRIYTNDEYNLSIIKK